LHTPSATVHPIHFNAKKGRKERGYEERKKERKKRKIGRKEERKKG
jgi:hypothetical protein